MNTLYVELFNPRNHEVVERTTVSSDGSFRFLHGANTGMEKSQKLLRYAAAH
jgi:hypothetical protein